MSRVPIVIIGGGIGGLSLANALHHFNLPFELYEQAPELTEAGAGIGLSQAPIQLLDRLGLGNSLRELGSPIQRVFMPDKKLKIRRVIMPSSEMICIHRAELINILKEKLPGTSIRLSKRAAGISVFETESEITFTDGDKIRSTCVAAADGIQSVIRKNLFPELKIRYINQTIWRGISDFSLPSPFQKSYIETWDEGLRFLVVPIGNHQTFWLAVQPAPPGGTDDPKTVRENLLLLFKNFHPSLKELIRTSKNFLRNDMADLGTQKRQWHKNGVVFLGDAIHATTPNLAQGGCQAIEDAWCLAKCLDKYGQDYQSAFQIYEKLRKPKVMKIVSDSWRFGKASHSKNPLFHYGFRTVLTHGPEVLLRRQENFLNDLSYLDKL